MAVNKESIQYEFMTRVISSVKMHIGKLASWQEQEQNGITLFLLENEVTAII